MSAKHHKPHGQTPTQDEAAPTGGPPEMPEAMRPQDPEPLEEGHAHQSAIDAGRSATEEEAEERQKALREQAEAGTAQEDEAEAEEREQAEKDAGQRQK